MKQVPLSRRVIFPDWHGVLSRDPFWVSIRPWLAAHGVEFTDTVLIDDRADNCVAFASQGGAPDAGRELYLVCRPH